jgi:hypothetical protein
VIVKELGPDKRMMAIPETPGGVDSA